MIFAREATVRATRERVWEILVDPARVIPVLPPGRSLVATTGTAGAAGSGYVLEVPAWPRGLRLEHTVTQSEPGAALRLEVRRAGRLLAVHEGTLSASEDGGTRLVWLVKAEAPPVWGWLVAYRGRLELGRWIAAVVQVAEQAG
ncbi:MAG TPA: hypothetical protein VI248_17445 [Kineosporiaceae bacterium]